MGALMFIESVESPRQQEWNTVEFRSGTLLGFSQGTGTQVGVAAVPQNDTSNSARRVHSGFDAFLHGKAPQTLRGLKKVHSLPVYTTHVWPHPKITKIYPQKRCTPPDFQKIHPPS